MPVDRLVADRQLPRPPKIPGHLFGAPCLPQQLLHPRKLLPPKLAVAPRPLPPRHRFLIRPRTTISAVIPRRVPPQLPPYRAPVPPKLPHDLRLAPSHAPQCRQRTPLFCIELSVVHPHPLCQSSPTTETFFLLLLPCPLCCTYSVNLRCRGRRKRRRHGGGRRGRWGFFRLGGGRRKRCGNGHRWRHGGSRRRRLDCAGYGHRWRGRGLGEVAELLDVEMEELREVLAV